MTDNIFVGPVADIWTKTRASYTAATFNTDQATWEAILADVIGMRLEPEFENGLVETTGIENFELTAPIPLSAGAVLRLSGLAGLGLAKRRKS